MAQDNIKVSADFNNDGLMDVVWAGRSDTLSDAGVGEGLQNKQVVVMGQTVTKLTLKPASDTALGGVKVDGDGLKIDNGKIGIKLGNGLSISSDGSLNATADGVDFSGSADDIEESATRIFFTPKEREKLVGLQNYVHPSNHPASMIIEEPDKRFMTDIQNEKLEGIEVGANNYVHPETHSLDMIVETSEKKIMTAGERSKLQGIEAGANRYVHPNTHSATMITETSDRFFVTAAEKQQIASINENGGISEYVHPATHPAAMIVEDTVRQFVTAEEKLKLRGFLNGVGRFSGNSAQDTVANEKVSKLVNRELLATSITDEVVVSDNDQFKVFRTKHKNIIPGTQKFFKNGSEIDPKGYEFDAENGVFSLYVANSAGTYTATYNYSEDGTLRVTAPEGQVVAGTHALYRDGIEVDPSLYTFDVATGVFAYKNTANLGPAVYTASYVKSPSGKLKVLRTPVVQDTIKVFKGFTEVADSDITVDYTSGEVVLNGYQGPANYTISYSHNQGTVITHNANLTDVGYRVIITPNGPTEGNLGEFWVDNKDANTFVVKNTGADADTRFDWMLMPEVDIPSLPIEPQIVSAETSDANTIVLEFDVNLKELEVSPSVFTIEGAESNPTVTGVVINGTNVTLTLDNAISASDSTVQVHYAPVGDSQLTSVQFVNVEPFQRLFVTNNVA
jgi:hypothetical protein